MKEGDIVRYPIGFTLVIKTLYADENGDLYVKQFIGDKMYPHYVFKTMEDYEWDTRLCKEPGFRLANSEEIKYFNEQQKI